MLCFMFRRKQLQILVVLLLTMWRGGSYNMIEEACMSWTPLTLPYVYLYLDCLSVGLLEYVLVFGMLDRWATWPTWSLCMFFSQQCTRCPHGGLKIQGITLLKYGRWYFMYVLFNYFQFLIKCPSIIISVLFFFLFF